MMVFLSDLVLALMAGLTLGAAVALMAHLIGLGRPR